MNFEILKSGKYDDNTKRLDLKELVFFYEKGEFYVRPAAGSGFLPPKLLWQILPNKTDQDAFEKVWQEIVADYHKNVIQNYQDTFAKIFT
ncbi:hypothetical protein UGMREWDR_CDS0199 [Aeromonas phage GomatiRiver_11]|nr:hypothetical protein OBDJBBDK_00198 [Aeromonas phage AhFM11]WKW84366.1 hypothetical protein UGMREWDR_CDS0199 [Aeromonas phage GomatiRiver_11]